ncbi:hypothetical protein RG903_00840 [Thermithiobacillus tepidarius DSM 3134]|uniref:hypothetical protein n=1 Tax=Thermithiobacillus tepidarius TaxID=929 RepID=UPI000426A509|nr:hypothetical protein [Thermithiobacillus tepidarius]
MDKAALNQRCVTLFQNPRVKLRLWNPRMFWKVEDKLSAKPESWSEPKVDLCELEVLLSAAAYEPSQCAEKVNQQEPGRADFIARQARGGMRPLLKGAA